MKFIVIYIQFIKSLEGLGMFFSSTAFIRRLRWFAATIWTNKTVNIEQITVCALAQK